MVSPAPINNCIPKMEVGCLEYPGAIHNSSPTYISSIFNERKSKYNLRGERALNIPSVNTTKYGLHSIRYFGPKLWNSISNDLHKLNLKEFKLALRNLTFSSYCCSFCNTQCCYNFKYRFRN